MPTIRRAVLSGLAALVASMAGVPALSQATSDRPAFRKGISLTHALGWAGVEADGSYADPPYGAANYRLETHQCRAIRAAGFDFVRLVVDVGPFLAFEGPRRARLDERLADTVVALLDADLGVIVDFHPSRMHAAYVPPALTAGVETPKFQAFLALLTRTAARLQRIADSRATGGRPPRLALEPMNEPEITPAAWQPMLEAAYHAARAGAARLPLVLGGGSMNAADALPALDMRPFAADRRLLYTFHDYDPWQFTHQGVRGNPAYGLDAVPYPAPKRAEAMIQATERRIPGLPQAEAGGAEGMAAARRALQGYAASGFDRTALERSFSRVTAWRTAQRLPADAILLGEFGVHRTPYQGTPEGQAARIHWLRDMRELAEAHGFAWAAWHYAGPGGFALAENEIGPGFDAATARALGLSPP